MTRAALISVSDKSNLIPFAKSLHELGYILLSTSGSLKTLQEGGLPAVSVEEYTNQKEILGGRVKTLHPKIHGGLLAKRLDPAHMAQLEEAGIMPIDIAVINLYPFQQGLQTEKRNTPKEMIELIDVGGPTMIRAAAKNFDGVLPVLDPADYDAVIAALKESKCDIKAISLSLRSKLSSKVFACTAAYDLSIAQYLSSCNFEDVKNLADAKGEPADNVDAMYTGVTLKKEQALRYGENPHQRASFFTSVTGSLFGEQSNEKSTWKQLHGKELSYNNFLDVDSCWKIACSLPKKENMVGAVIVKHLNPCGAAYGKNLTEALQRAKKSDPRSHFGGVIAVNTKLEKEAAEIIAADFAEIIIAPEFSAEALTILQKSKNLRIIECSGPWNIKYEMRSIGPGVLVQELDTTVSDVKNAELKSTVSPTANQYDDLALAWNVCSHVKSNAIVLAKDGYIIGVGAGQMSRIDSVEIAVMKAKFHGHDISGAVAASDAFFPFPDSVEYLASHGVKAIIAPGGAKRDGESIDEADKVGIALLFASDRHFRH